ncbi:MAG: dihydrolipoyl dehydrogenase [Bacteroidaceae bacterium]|nr:dihydrolipoyl dehydrogenase [Bacteroidaceae bacterium]
MHAQIIIIGGGPGGYETAVNAAKRGMEVVLISEGPLGGTCLNEGCIPTKTLQHLAAEGGLSLNAMQEKKAEVVNTLRGGIDILMKNKLITFVQGRAILKDNHTVEADGQEFTAKKIIIATGSVAASLPIEGADDPRVITSKELLELEEVPHELCIIGGGVIGLEFACIFNRLGSHVVVLEYCKQLLPRFDTDLAKRLKQSLSRSGIEIKTGYEVTNLNDIEADKILMAVGRRPNLESLNLDTLGIEYTKRGIVVDGNMQTSVPDIYAIGDIAGGMMLAHVATYQGIRALNHIEGKTDKIRFDLVPAAVFTTPEVAVVGLTEEQCKEQGLQFRSLKSFYRANGKAVSMGETDGYCKLLVDCSGTSTDGQILGCHIMGADASIIIHEPTALMNLGATLSDLQQIIHAHPTLSEIIQSAANS